MSLLLLVMLPLLLLLLLVATIVVVAAATAIYPRVHQYPLLPLVALSRGRLCAQLCACLAFVCACSSSFLLAHPHRSLSVLICTSFVPTFLAFIHAWLCLFHAHLRLFHAHLHLFVFVWAHLSALNT